MWVVDVGVSKGKILPFVTKGLQRVFGGLYLQSHCLSSGENYQGKIILTLNILPPYYTRIAKNEVAAKDFLDFQPPTIKGGAK